jgi:hypothetical protein
MRYNLLALLFSLCFGISQNLNVNAQLVDVIVETFGFSSGSYPSGHTTYRVYARVQHSSDFVAAVYGVGAQAGENYHSLIIGDNISESGSTTFWNSVYGGVTGPDINSAFCAIFPDVCYDSFITIGRHNSSSPGGTINVDSNPPNQFDLMFGNTSTIGYPIEITNGSWSATTGDINGFPVGADKRVLIMQITCPTGSFEYQINVLVYDNGNPDSPHYYVHTLEETTGVYNGINEVDYTAQGLVYPHGFCDLFPQGCMNPNAINYEPSALCEDGSCILPDFGCTYPLASNYNPFVETDDGSCEFDGCTDPLASNYNELANHNDGTCEYEFPCPGDLNGDGTVGVPDLLVIIGNYGSNCP